MAALNNFNTLECPPPYEESRNADNASENIVQDDGRIVVDVNSPMNRTLSRLIKSVPGEQKRSTSKDHDRSADIDRSPLRLNIVIQMVGSHGDVQPFLALGNALQDHGHRVRLATHEKFRAFVMDCGLEFFAIGGDPEDLMVYMVKNPGLMPSMSSLKAGDIPRKREMIAEMLDGCWRSCIKPDGSTGAPFVADAIIANPPSFAHIHCAEALGITLHMIFTMPWTSTAGFAHPLAVVKGLSSNTSRTNYMTHLLVG